MECQNPLTNCARCGNELTAEEKYYYGATCNTCEGIEFSAPETGTTAEKSPTFGMNLGQRIAHVGGRVTESLTVEFGSAMAVNALIHHVLRDVPQPQLSGPRSDAHAAWENYFSPEYSSQAHGKSKAVATSLKNIVRQLDDHAVDVFAAAMKRKLAAARKKGRGGWQNCSIFELSCMLREHVEKGDPTDVANFAMFLWSLGSGIHPLQAPPKAHGSGEVQK
jgi:hypothetical protein